MTATPLYSVVVPVYREGTGILACLDRLEEMKGIEKAEVIVVDGDRGSTLTCIPQHSFAFSLRTAVTPPGRGRQLAEGAKRATGSTLLFLHVDTQLRGSALDEIGKILRYSPAGAFDLFVVTTSYYIKVVAAFATIRSRLSRIPYGDQAHFMRSSVYHDAGGYRNLPIMEDVEFMGRLKRKGYRIRFASTFAVNPDRRWRKEGAIKRTLVNWSMMLSYRLGVSEQRLAGFYRPQAEA